MGTDDKVINFEKFLDERPITKRKEKFEGNINPEYKECVVAFIDMLGMSAFMKSINITDKSDAPNKYNTVSQISEQFKALSDFLRISVGKLSKMEISDSFILSVPLEAIDKLIKMLAELQYSLLIKHQFLLRGAIVKGIVIGNVEDSRIIGPAFISAYQMERENAVYPRIIIDHQLDEQCKEYVVFDEDGYGCIDFVNFRNNVSVKDASKLQLLIDKELKSQKSKEKKEEPEKYAKIIQKWVWLQNFVKTCDTQKEEK